MIRPDFGQHVIEHEGIKLACRYVAPGLTMSDLMEIFREAESHAQPGDELRGDPSKWPASRGIHAVVEAVLSAIYVR